MSLWNLKVKIRQKLKINIAIKNLQSTSGLVNKSSFICWNKYVAVEMKYINENKKNIVAIQTKK